MTILNETTTLIAQDAKNFSSKLKNMKMHLQELINKNLRIEAEIKSLKKTLLTKQKEYERTLKTKLKVETSGIIDSDTKQRIIKEDPQLHFYLLEFDRLENEIYMLLESNKLLEESEK